MKKLIAFIICFCSLSAMAQYPPNSGITTPAQVAPMTIPNIGSTGSVSQRGGFLQTLFIPTINGAPTNLQMRNIGLSALVYDSTGKKLYAFSPKDSTFGILAGGGSPVDSVNVHSYPYRDSMFYYTSGTAHFIKVFYHPDGLIKPGIVTYASGTTFTVTGATYSILGTIYNSNDTTQILAGLPASGHSRFDIIYVLTNSKTSHQTGTLDAGVPPTISPDSAVVLAVINVRDTGVSSGGGATPTWVDISGYNTSLLPNGINAGGKWTNSGAGSQIVVSNGSNTTDNFRSENTSIGGHTYSQRQTNAGDWAIYDNTIGASRFGVSSAGKITAAGVSNQLSAANRMVVKDTATGIFGTQPIPGGGSTPDLQTVTDVGFTTTNDIVLSSGASLDADGSVAGGSLIVKDAGFSKTFVHGVSAFTANATYYVPEVASASTIAFRAADSVNSPTNMIYQGLDGLFHKAAVPSGGSTNSNIGSGFRFVVPLTNNVKTFFAGSYLLLDSSSNSNALTIKTDTTNLFARVRAIIHDSVPTSSTLVLDPNQYYISSNGGLDTAHAVGTAGRMAIYGATGFLTSSSVLLADSSNGIITVGGITTTELGANNSILTNKDLILGSDPTAPATGILISGSILSDAITINAVNGTTVNGGLVNSGLITTEFITVNQDALVTGNLEVDGGIAVPNGTISSTNFPISGHKSQVGTATTTFTVTIGSTLSNSTYAVTVTPTAALAAALFYVTNKTTTTFDVVYLAGLTGTVTFDWVVNPIP